MAPLFSTRGLRGSFARAGLAALFAALACFFDAPALALLALAARLPLGAPFLWVAPFLEIPTASVIEQRRKATEALRRIEQESALGTTDVDRDSVLKFWTPRRS